MQEYCIYCFKETYGLDILESPHWGDYNKYPRHMFYEEIRTKQDLSYISVC